MSHIIYMWHVHHYTCVCASLCTRKSSFKCSHGIQLDKVCVGGAVPCKGKTCSKVGMDFASLCVVIIKVMFSEQPFYIVVLNKTGQLL